MFALQFLDNIMSAATSSKTRGRNDPPTRHSIRTPKLRVKLDLTPDPADASGKEGHVTFKVGAAQYTTPPGMHEVLSF